MNHSYQEEKLYTVSELSRITGLEYTRFYSYQDLFEMKKYVFPSKRIGYAIKTYDFEKVLNATRSYDFVISEFLQYEQFKRPIIRQFFNVNETTQFLKAIGDEVSIHTVKRWVRENKIPAYMIRRKYIIPIIYLIKRYTLLINKELNHTISNIIESEYEFKL